MNLLELFAGSRSIGSVGEELGMKVFSSDINNFENIDYVTDILEFDVTNVHFIPDVIWASPPCTFFSVASIGRHWYKDHTPKSESAVLGMEIVKKTIEIIDYFLGKNPNLIYFMENPRGKLRKLDFMQRFDRTTVMYCQYGDDRMKPTDIWSNNINSMYNDRGFEAKVCFNGNKGCHHQPAPRGSQTGTQGRKGSYERSKIPKELCLDVLNSAVRQYVTYKDC